MLLRDFGGTSVRPFPGVCSSEIGPKPLTASVSCSDGKKDTVLTFPLNAAAHTGVTTTYSPPGRNKSIGLSTTSYILCLRMLIDLDSTQGISPLRCMS